MHSGTKLNLDIDGIFLEPISEHFGQIGSELELIINEYEQKLYEQDCLL